MGNRAKTPIMQPTEAPSYLSEQTRSAHLLTPCYLLHCNQKLQDGHDYHIALRFGVSQINLELKPRAVCTQ